jgi:adenine phosphoribosyltransferase
MKLLNAVERIRSSVRDIPNFPKEGITFKDITPVLQDATLYRLIINLLVEEYRTKKIDVIVGIDARGFLFAGALSYILGTGLSIVRKKGKLPYDTVEESYDLEYGTATLAMHTDAIKPGQRVLVIDDVLATGGTAKAACNLIERLGGKIVEVAFLIELSFLDGKKTLGNTPTFSMLKY